MNELLKLNIEECFTKIKKHEVIFIINKFNNMCSLNNQVLDLVIET